MPRTLQDILDHGEKLATRVEDYRPEAGDEHDPEAVIAMRQSVMARSAAERAIQEAVAVARSQGYSWRPIGALIGTSGEAARQRYGANAKV